MTLFFDDPTLWLWLGVLTLITFLGTLGFVPWLILQLPHDYFMYDRPRELPWDKTHPALKASLLILKNLLGAIFVFVGLMMLVLPGQGMLTILLGVLLLDFPGKFKLECWLIRRSYVLDSVNWLRRRHGRSPLQLGKDC